MTTGSASMMSPAVTPSSRVAKWLWATAARAEPPSIQPSTMYQRPAEPVVGRQADEDAVAHHQRREALAQVGGEARRPVPVAGQLPRDRAGDPAAVERERGQHVEHEQRGVGERRERDHHLEQRAGGGGERRGVREAVAEHRDADGGEAGTSAAASRPGRRTRPGTPRRGSRESRSARMKPPKKNRSMPTTPIPSRRAASACPSSCSTIEPKNRNAEMTEAMNA